MAQVTTEIIATLEARHPFKVVIKVDDEIIAEQPVTSLRAAQELSEVLAPTLNGFEVPSNGNPGS